MAPLPFPVVVIVAVGVLVYPEPLFVRITSKNLFVELSFTSSPTAVVPPAGGALNVIEGVPVVYDPPPSFVIITRSKVPSL